MTDVVPIEPTRAIEVSLPGNTDKAKEGASPEKKEAKVIAKAKVNKTSPIKEALKTFFVDDLPDIANHLVIDVAIPAAKNAITDMVTQGIQQLLYGAIDVNRGRSGTYTSYGSASRTIYTRGTPDNVQYSKSRRTSHPNSNRVDDLIFETKPDAMDVIEYLAETIERHGQVSVADLYSSVGIKTQYTDERWGWTTLDAFEVRFSREGWIIVSQSPEPIK